MKILNFLGLRKKDIPPVKNISNEEWRKRYIEKRIEKLKTEPYGWVIEQKYKGHVWENEWNHKLYATKEIAEEALASISEYRSKDYSFKIYPVFIKIEE